MIESLINFMPHIVTVLLLVFCTVTTADGVADGVTDFLFDKVLGS